MEHPVNLKKEGDDWLVTVNGKVVGYLTQDGEEAYITVTNHEAISLQNLAAIEPLVRFTFRIKTMRK